MVLVQPTVTALSTADGLNAANAAQITLHGCRAEARAPRAEVGLEVVETEGLVALLGLG